VTTRRNRGKPARWPWRSRLDVFLFFSAVGISGFLFLFLFFWRFSCAFLFCYPSTPAPFPPPPPPKTSLSTSPSLPPPPNTQHSSTSLPSLFPPSPCPFLALPLPRHSAQQHQLSPSPPPSFFLFFLGRFYNRLDISKRRTAHTSAVISANYDIQLSQWTGRRSPRPPLSARLDRLFTSDSHTWVSRRQWRQKVGISIVISDVFLLAVFHSGTCILEFKHGENSSLQYAS